VSGRSPTAGPALRAEAALALAAALAAAPAGASALSPPCATCVRWEVGVGEVATAGLAEVPLDGLPLLLEEDVDAATASALARGGARIARAVSLFTAGLPADLGALEALVLEARPDDPQALDDTALRVKTLSTEARARHAAIVIGLEAAPQVLAELWARGVGAYVDHVVVSGGAAAPPGAAAWIRADDAASTSVTGALEATRAGAGGRVLLRWPADPAVAFRVHALREVFPEGLSALGEVAVGCEPWPEGVGGAGAHCAAEVFLHPATLDAIAIARPRGETRAVRIAPGAVSAALLPFDTASPPVRALVLEAGVGGARASIPARAEPFALRISGWAGEGERFAAGLDVVDEKSLRVEEVVARHQAAAARQRGRIGRLIAQGTSVLSFQVPGLAAPVTITADTVLYSGPDGTELEQRRIRLNGAERVDVGRDGVPRLPIVEPERAERPPLTIALDEAYRYALEGREPVDGRDAYVVRFEPRDGARPLFRGRAWIDARHFAIVRLQAAQTGLRGAIVSSEQRDEFTPVVVGGVPVWLLARSEVHQAYEGAGHRTPIHRVLTLARHEVEPPDYDARRRAAHASASVILRETAEGLRYLRKPATAEAAGERTLAPGRASSVRTLALGAIVDPNISTPLPFAGLSYLDFDFLGTGTQVNAFFAGAFVMGSAAVPSLGGSRWQLHGSVFATLAEYNDRAFLAGREQYAENLRQRPARLGLALVRPLSPSWRLRLGYELDYTRLRRSDLTAPDFLAPASPLVHALRVGLEGQRGPWTFAAWWSPARRARWRAWGWGDRPGDAVEEAGFQRFGVSAARTVVLSPAALIRVETAAMGGTDLDRFSRFSFDAFENRLRGYPSAGLRFDRGAVVRAVGTWNVARAVRLDAFADTAYARDPGFGPGLRRYSGLGAGLEAPLPGRALLAAEWGYGFEGLDREGRRGTHVFRVTAYKLF
jgi:hypothetical protein